MRTSVARQTVHEFTPFIDERLGSVNTRLDTIEAQLRMLAEEVRELRSIIATQVDVENQSASLIGQLLRSATTRIEELEERVEQAR